MIWDSTQRRFEDLQGRPVDPRAVKKIVDSFIESERKLVSVEAIKVVDSSALTLDELESLNHLNQFFELMRDKIASWHSISGSIAYGGQDQMNAERWARINQKVTSELEYLANFEREARQSMRSVSAIAEKIAREYPDAQAQLRQSISQALLKAAPGEAESVAQKTVNEIIGRDSIIVVSEQQAQDLLGGQIVNRTEMYPDAMWSTYENNVMAREFDEGVRLGRRVCADDDASCEECVAAAEVGFVPLDQLDEIGSLQCLNNCRCEFEFDVEGARFATSDLFTGVITGQDQYGGSVELQ